MPKADPIAVAVSAAGGVSALAAKLGIRRQAIHKWRRSGQIPPLQARAIHDKLGTPLHLLRPDLWPEQAA